MNSLTWFIYLADVLPGLPWIFLWASIVTCVFMFFGLLVVSETDENVGPYITSCGQVGKYFITPLMVIFVISLAIAPSQKTIYLMAGSEIGEDVINTPEAQQVKDILRKYLSEVTDTVKKGDDK